MLHYFFFNFWTVVEYKMICRCLCLNRRLSYFLLKKVIKNTPLLELPVWGEPELSGQWLDKFLYQSLNVPLAITRGLCFALLRKPHCKNHCKFSRTFSALKHRYPSARCLWHVGPSSPPSHCQEDAWSDVVLHTLQPWWLHLNDSLGDDQSSSRQWHWGLSDADTTHSTLSSARWHQQKVCPDYWNLCGSPAT